MRRAVSRRPSPAMVVSILALLVAMSGSSYAAIRLSSHSVGFRQLKPGAVHRSDIATGAVNSAKVADGSLLAADFKHGQLPLGAPGATGAKGAPGAPGSIGPVGPSTGPASGDLAGTFPSPTIASKAVTTTKLADGGVTYGKLAVTTVVSTVDYQATPFEQTTAKCQQGSTVLSGGAGVVDAGDAPLAGIAAVSYSAPVVAGNGWVGAAYRTLANPQVNSSYGLLVFAVCIAQ